MKSPKRPAEHLVEHLLEAEGDPESIKDFMDRHFTPLPEPDRKHLFVGHDGDLYDTRNPDWHRNPPLRKGYKHFHTEINNLAEFKATWRARHQSNYSLGFLVDDGAVLCEPCVKDNLQRVMRSVRDGDNDGWRVVGVGTLHGDPDGEEGHYTQCAHCGKNLGELG